MTEAQTGQGEWSPANWPKFFAEFPLHQFLGLEIEEGRPGYARIAMTPGRNTLGGVGGSVHGGVLAALVDIAMLRAILPMLEAGETPGGTVDLNITYLRPAHGPRVCVEANVIRKGRTIAVTEVDITDANGKLCARGRTIYAIRPPAPA